MYSGHRRVCVCVCLCVTIFLVTQKTFYSLDALGPIALLWLVGPIASKTLMLQICHWSFDFTTGTHESVKMHYCHNMFNVTVT